MSLNKNPHRQVWYKPLKEVLKQADSTTTEIPIMPQRYFGEETLEDLSKRYRYLANSYSIRAGLNLVIGHSIGGALGLYMAQYVPIQHLVLVGAYLPPGLDWTHIHALVKKVTIIYEAEDPSIPLAMTKAIISHFDPALITVHEMPSKDHLNSLTAEKLYQLINTRTNLSIHQ